MTSLPSIDYVTTRHLYHGDCKTPVQTLRQLRRASVSKDAQLQPGESNNKG